MEIREHLELYIEPSQAYEVAPFCKCNCELKTVNYVCKKAPSLIFGKVLNMSLTLINRVKSVLANRSFLIYEYKEGKNPLFIKI